MLRDPAVTAAFLLVTLVARPSFADENGLASVVDGDTIVIDGQRAPAADAPG